MLELTNIHEPLAALLAEQLEDVTVVFERQLASDLSAVNGLCRHIEHYRGKMLRPSLVLLSGLAGSETPDGPAALDERHRILAAVVEMIHMATLVHDDVLDEASIRRRGTTINNLWGNEAAVMLGDYLISNAFHLCSTIGDPAINLALGEVTNTLCEGELMQLRRRDDYGIDEATYFQIVRRKTASLIGASCRLGATLSGSAEPVTGALQAFGESLGVAFQIQDDLLDLVGEETVVGKSLGKDLDKGKLTLPVIHHLARTDQRGRGEALELIARRDGAGLRLQLIASGAVQSSRDTAVRFIREARANLPLLAESPARDLLHRLAEAVAARQY